MRFMDRSKISDDFQGIVLIEMIKQQENNNRRQIFEVNCMMLKTKILIDQMLFREHFKSKFEVIYIYIFWLL